ncbi:MAG TPA: cobalamin B12-binding domain-containing protein [Solirubrobacteraceae bacterium]|nr:cobalamin B12-binding domain-containing protein [Solirubrobacteraceae bacterium]
MVAPGASWMPIGELSRRVGVSTDLLRKWERRYGVLKPGRTNGNQRLYSRVDEARVRLMISHVRSGIAPAQAAELALGARFKLTRHSGEGAAVEEAAAGRRQVLAALERYDETGAEQVLEKIAARSAATTLIRDVFLPLLREIGERWASARLNVAQEHFASGFVHTRLLALARGWDRGLGPRALLACPAGEQHVMGLVSFGIVLHQVGWRITYLGADTPPAGLADAAEMVQPRLVVLSCTMAGRLEPHAAVLRRLTGRFPVAVAGAGATSTFAAAADATHLTGDPVTAAERMLI